MDNPWKQIPFTDYERHMTDPQVGQLPVLNSIFQQQYSDYLPSSLTVFGICTGNGLEHVNPSVTSLVSGVDVNGDYLRECDSRFRNRGYTLNLIQADLNLESITLPLTHLFIANLFLEYVEIQKVLSVVKESAAEGAVMSVVIQLTQSDSFVSESIIQSLKTLETYHVNVDAKELIDTMKRNAFSLIHTQKYPLPGKKEFVRLDFRLQ